MSREQLLNDIRTVAAITFEARQFKNKLLKMSDEDRLEYVKQNLLTTDLHSGHGEGVYISFQYMEEVDDQHSSIVVGFQWEDCGRGGEGAYISFQYMEKVDSKHSSIVVGFQWEDCGRGGEVIPSPRKSLTDDGDEFVTPIMRLTFKSDDVSVDSILSDGFDDDEFDDDESEFDSEYDSELDEVYNSSQELLNKLVKVDVVSYNESKLDGDPLFVITPDEDQILVDFGIPVSEDTNQFFQYTYDIKLDDELLLEIKEVVSEVTRYEY